MIYFDNSATTPPIIPPTWVPASPAPPILANPSSPHALGITAERALATARTTLASILGCTPAEVIFTSGGTESNSLGLIGYALAHHRKGLTFFAHPWEHPSILQPLKFIKDQGLAEVVITPDINIEEIATKSPYPVLAISHINNETGDINPIGQLGKNLKAQNPASIIIVDNAQGFCKEPLGLANVDMLTLSGHKCHGPTGVGALFLNSKVRIKPLMYGGGQEGGLRPGTENTGGVISMVQAVEKLHVKQVEHHNHVATIKALIHSVVDDLPHTYVNCASPNTSPYILNLSFLGLKGEVLVHALSQKGLCVSMGAACQSRKKDKSVLEAMGFKKDRAESAIRFSFSHLNTLEEAAMAKKIIIGCVTDMRNMLGVNYGN